MDYSFNILHTFPVETDFSFYTELEKMRFKRLDDPFKDDPVCYGGFLYDYESDSVVSVYVEQEEVSFNGIYSKYISIYKGNKKSGQVIYYGLKPESKFVYQILFSHLFPSKGFINQYEESVLGREYKLISKFNLENELNSLGFESQNKSQECLFTNKNYSIYCAVYDGENFDDEGHPTGMVIENNVGKTLYKGRMPEDIYELFEILYRCEINC